MDSTSIVHLVRTLNETSWWEIAYVISNCVIAFFAIFALFQFRFYKRESNQRTIREKALLALNLNQDFINIVIPRYNLLEKRLGEKLTNLQYKQVVKSSKESISQSNEELVSFIKKDENLLNDVLAFLNKLDVFATTINSGLADEEIVYTSGGSSFCDFVSTFFPFLNEVLYFEDVYSNLIDLYNNWSKRLTEKREKQISSYLE